MTDTPIPETILAQAKAGTLASFLGDRFGWLEGKEFDAAVAACVDLHNNGQIDLVGLVHEPAFKSLDSSDFFFAQHVFVEAIPTLVSPVDAMLACIDALVEQAGEDGAANQPLKPLATWLQTDPVRALELAAKAEAGEQRAQKHYHQTLVAIADISRARKACDEFDGERRLAAVSALGEIPHDSDETACTFDLFANLHEMNRGDDALHAALVSACVSLADRHPSLAEPARVLCDALVQTAGPSTAHFCARAIWLRKVAQTDAALAEILLRPLQNIMPSNKGTVRELDFALGELMKAGAQTLAIDFVTSVLGTPGCKLALKEFHMFSSALAKSALFPATIVRWLKTGAPALCEGLVSLMTGDSLSGQVVTLPTAVVAMPADKQLFVCRKAVGYFFFQPITAASIVVSFLRNCAPEARDEVAELLFMPLLRNYGGDMRDYLETVATGDPAHPAIVAALDVNRRYLEGMSKVGVIAEMAPSEHQRLIEHMRRRDEAAQTFKMAREQSVLMQFVKNSTILYGKRSLNYVGAGEARRVVETELQPHSVSMEMPRMMNIDPVGLDYLLRTLRNEKFSP